jgi:hypothetical protein
LSFLLLKKKNCALLLKAVPKKLQGWGKTTAGAYVPACCISKLLPANAFLYTFCMYICSRFNKSPIAVNLLNGASQRCPIKAQLPVN